MNAKRYALVDKDKMRQDERGFWVFAGDAEEEITALESQVADLEKRLHYAQKILEKIKIISDDTF